MTTRGPLPRIPRLLELVRPYVDEIVLAVDRTGNLDVLDACADLADRRMTFDYAAPPCRNIGFLQHECSADWLLRFDDDEVPSRALLDSLAELVADRRPTHYGLSRRWLYPDAGTYVLSPPWLPDYQLRLVRNVPGIWRFTGEMHDGAIVLGERRLVDRPIYHGDLLLLDVDARRRKAEKYERLRPDHLSEGVPVNAIYVPEDWESVETAAVPEEDRATLAHVLAPAREAPVAGARGGERPPVPHVSLEQIDRFNTNRAVGDGAYQARLEFVRPVVRVTPGIVREQEVRVENLGDEVWPWGADATPPIRLGYRWRSKAGDEVLGEGPRTPFTESIAPGRSSLQKLVVEMPTEPGRYVLEADVVHEAVRWFDCAARLEVEVVEPGPPDTDGGRGARLRSYLRQARERGPGAGPALLLYRRWAASLAPERTPIADRRPWITFSAASALEAAVGPGTRVCEFGVGGSTAWLLDRGANVTSIEYDEAWAAVVGETVRGEHRPAWSLEVARPEEDPHSRRLDPSDPDAYVSASPAFLGFSFGSYARAIERFADGALDVVLVAGRARPSCLRHALAKVCAGGLVLLDHAERSWYQPALALASGAGWDRVDHAGPGPYAERFWQTTVLRRRR